MTSPLLTDEFGTFKIGGDLRVRRVGYGAMHITGDGIWGPPADHAGAMTVLRAVVDSGVNLIDTADSYGPYVSEVLIAETLYPYPDDLVIATKGGLERTGPGEWSRNARPEQLKSACEGSLKRLRMDAIPLYHLHYPDPDVPYAESVGTLKELQEAGKIRHIGVSNVSVEQLAEARSIVDVVSVQNRFNLMDRDAADLLDVCDRDELAFLPWFSLAGGEVGSDTAHAVSRIAQARGISAHQVALAWLLAQSPIVIPIPGTANPQHLADNIGAVNVALTQDELRELDGQG